MEKRFSDATKDAAAIAAEVVALGYAAGWFGDVRIAAAVEAELAPINIGLRGSTWVHMPGGTDWLDDECVAGPEVTAELPATWEEPAERATGRGR